MKIEFTDEQLELLLETLGKCHAIAYWKNDAHEMKELGDLVSSVISEAEKQGKMEIVNSVFQECEPPK